MLSMRGNRITWFGHATFQVTTASGQVLMIDPWIESNPKCPDKLKRLERLDVLLITHGHSDHFADVLPLARKFHPKIVAIYETGAWLQSKGVKNTLPMSKGGTQVVEGIGVTMVHALHSNSMEDDGKLIYGGEPAGFVVRLPDGPSIYHAGDTSVFSDMKLIGEIYKPDVALLPIGDHFTMGPLEASHAIRLLDVRHVIPMHYGTFPALTGTPEILRQLTKDIAGLEIHAIKPGESLG